MANEIFNRVEKKFLLNSKQSKGLLNAIDNHMEKDEHLIDKAFYTITNLYYDTEDDYLIKHSLSKPVFKEKLRLRAYGKVNLESMVFIELKKKINGVVHKRRSLIKLCDAYYFINSKERPQEESYHNTLVLREIEQFLKRYPVKASTFIAYDRVAYKADELRVTLDYKIRTRKDQLRLEYGDHGDLLLESDYTLLETKSSLGLPLWLTHTLSEEKIYKTSFSKYGKDFVRRSRDIHEKGVLICSNLSLAIPQQQILQY